MRARIKWTEGMSFVGETGSGHALVIDGAPEHGGRDLGPRPMELVLAGAAACTAFDVVLILKKARQPVADCVVEAEADRAAVEPKVFTRIRLAYTIAGRGLDPRQVERAVKPQPDALGIAHPVGLKADPRDVARGCGSGFSPTPLAPMQETCRPEGRPTGCRGLWVGLQPDGVHPARASVT